MASTFLTLYDLDRAGDQAEADRRWAEAYANWTVAADLAETVGERARARWLRSHARRMVAAAWGERVYGEGLLGTEVVLGRGGARRGEMRTFVLHVRHPVFGTMEQYIVTIDNQSRVHFQVGSGRHRKLSRPERPLV